MPVRPHHVQLDITSPDAEFALVFTERAPRPRRVAFLLCGDWHQADDLVQTTFVKLYAARLRDRQARSPLPRRSRT